MTFLLAFKKTNENQNKHINVENSVKTAFVICPIAMAYSVGNVMKSVYVCQSVSLSVCQCVRL